jgi:NAD(P)-dependent dehydrogenase (short-subunit alcohol dehydrogenase family)
VTVPPRVVLVTGASSGIGRAAALQAAADGDTLVLVARGEEPLSRVAGECRAAGAGSVLVRPTDVCDDLAVRDLLAGVLTDLGRIDAVIHCAGVVAYGRTEEIPAEVFDGVVSTNVLGSVNIARHAVPALRKQESGSLVLVGSVIGHIGVPGMTPYVVSKWAVRALARQLQLENRDRPGVHVSYLSPGGVDTPIYRQAGNYSGYVGRPPPPVSSPERVARVALRLTRVPRSRRQVGLANGVMRLGFSAFPGVFDLLVGPLFTVAAKDRTEPVGPTTGNVLGSVPGENALHGHQGNAVLGIARNIVGLMRSGRA